MIAPNAIGTTREHDTESNLSRRQKGCITTNVFVGASGAPFSVSVLLTILVSSAVSARALAAENAARAVDGSHVESRQSTTYLGASACAAAACHGGTATAYGEADAWRGSYTVWASQDAHSRAAATLFDKRSRGILRRFIKDDADGWNLRDPQQRKTYEGHLKQHCAQCHATGGSNEADDKNHEDVFANGVSCGACHGQTGDWLVPHTTHTWQKKSDAEKYVTWGAVSGEFSWTTPGSGVGDDLDRLLSDGQARMINTRNLLTRARVCVKCHVGEPAGENHPRGDVNHDLIAAGHPRLNFELSTYMASMPAHWDESNDRTWADKRREADPPGTRRTDFDAEQWFAGQVVTAYAALQQLRWRAEHANGDAVWPEFSEYDCYACHHDLGSRRYRQQESSIGSRGNYVWGTWYFAMTSVAADALNVDPTSLSLVQLKDQMARRIPDNSAVEQECRTLMESLARLPLSGALTKRKLAQSIASRHETLNLRNWDETTQWFLAASAIARAPTASPMPNAAAAANDSDQRPDIGKELNELRARLRFDAKTGPDASDAKDLQFDSPHSYDPRDVQPIVQQIAHTLKEFSMQDGSLPAPR